MACEGDAPLIGVRRNFESCRSCCPLVRRIAVFEFLTDGFVQAICFSTFFGEMHDTASLRFPKPSYCSSRSRLGKMVICAFYIQSSRPKSYALQTCRDTIFASRCIPSRCAKFPRHCFAHSVHLLRSRASIFDVTEFSDLGTRDIDSARIPQVFALQPTLDRFCQRIFSDQREALLGTTRSILGIQTQR